MYVNVIDMNNYCHYVANATAMLYGQVTFSTVMRLLVEIDTYKPHNVTAARFAAMVVQSTMRD